MCFLKSFRSAEYMNSSNLSGLFLDIEMNLAEYEFIWFNLALYCWIVSVHPSHFASVCPDILYDTFLSTSVLSVQLLDHHFHSSPQLVQFHLPSMRAVAIAGMTAAVARAISGGRAVAIALAVVVAVAVAVVVAVAVAFVVAVVVVVAPWSQLQSRWRGRWWGRFR
jgi:hypothetical protein